MWLLVTSPATHHTCLVNITAAVSLLELDNDKAAQSSSARLVSRVARRAASFLCTLRDSAVTQLYSTYQSDTDQKTCLRQNPSPPNSSKPPLVSRRCLSIQDPLAVIPLLYPRRPLTTMARMMDPDVMPDDLMLFQDKPSPRFHEVRRNLIHFIKVRTA